MEYFEKRALGPELPVSFTINTWLRYVDDVLTIVKKGTRDSLLNYLNSIDPNCKGMEVVTPGSPSVVV